MINFIYMVDFLRKQFESGLLGNLIQTLHVFEIALTSDHV